MSRLLLLLQTIVAPLPEAERAANLDTFDLANVHSDALKCGEHAANGDIVVCAQKAMNAPLIDRVGYHDQPVRTAVKLPGGGSVALTASQRQLPGAKSQAALVTLKLRF